MNRFWRISTTLTSVYYALMIEYRAEIFLWVLAGVFPLIMMGMWMAASAIHPMSRSPGEFARYFFIAFMVRQLTNVWVNWEFESDVVEGRLSPYLLQPLDPVFRYVGEHVGERLTRMPLLVAFAVAFYWLVPAARWQPSVAAVALTAIACILAFILQFAISYTFAMLAFWVERAGSIQEMIWLVNLFLSGMLAPLDFYPAAARHAADLTPFPYLIYFPVEILMGRQTHLGMGFLVMLGWIAALILINRIMWSRGLRRYSAMGA